MSKNGNSLSYIMRQNAISAKSSNPGQRITDCDTIRTYKAAIKRFVAFASSSGYNRDYVLEHPVDVLQQYTDSLTARGLSAATIHTYISAPCKSLDVRMQQISKPQRAVSDITRSRGQNNVRGVKDAQKGKFERLVTLQNAVGLRRSELADLRGSDLRVIGGNTYVHVAQGKGGKEQWQRILPHDVATVRQVFNGVASKDRVFDANEMHNRIDLHGMRASHARDCYDYYAKQIKSHPEYRNQLKQDLQHYFFEHHNRGDVDMAAYARFCQDMTRNQGVYQMRGDNRQIASQNGRPTDYDRVALMAVSVYHLAHWRLDVTAVNYMSYT